MTVLQRKIDSLSKSEQAEVLKFVNQLLARQKKSPDELFDKKIKADSESGKLDQLAEEAILQYNKGNFREL
jgi:hypothetical protein